MLHRIPGAFTKIRSSLGGTSGLSFASANGSPGSFLRRVPGALMARGRQLLTGGFDAVSYSIGTITSGTVTIDGKNGAKQHMTNNGAHTLAPPIVETTVELEVLNGASAALPTTSGFTKADLSAYATTNAAKFIFYITKTKNYSYVTAIALQ